LSPNISPIGHEEKALRERYFGAEYAKKHYSKKSDAIIDGAIVEFKSGSKTNLSINIGKAAKQSDVVIIKMTDVATDVHIEEVINKQWSIETRKHLTEIIIINNGALHVFKRP
jgi:hypothetical protein